MSTMQKGWKATVDQDLGIRGRAYTHVNAIAFFVGSMYIHGTFYMCHETTKSQPHDGTSCFVYKSDLDTTGHGIHGTRPRWLPAFLFLFHSSYPLACISKEKIPSNP